MEVLATYMNDKPPEDMHANSQSRELEITWDQTISATIPCRNLRLACHCAACVDEITSKRIVDPATIPEDIVIIDMQLVGNYALKTLCGRMGTTPAFTHGNDLRSCARVLLD